MKKIVLILIPVITLLAVSFTTINKDSNKGGSVCDSLNMSSQEHLVMSVVWYQKSAEMKALYYQGFNFAKVSIENKFKNVGPSTKSAIVLDIDETVLDNSPYEAMMINKGIPYSTKTWKEWTKLAKAKPTPGVVDFLNYVKSKGIQAFYVSNRDMDERDATIKNMLAENIPFADTTHLLLRVNGNSNKTDRYKSVEKNYKILLTIGDNLRDYSEIFANRKINYGMNMADSLKTTFGEDFIILPNPMYGDWEKAVYGGKFPSEVEKNKLRKAAMVSY
jgi:5'-nucleotidase (lipoprotein e(P4) family)